MDWNDLKIALVASRAESMSEAARRLGVNQTTVSRRLQAFEDSLGTSLFHRIDGRLVPTRACEILLEEAEAAERHLLQAEERVGGLDGRAEGTVRLTAAPTVMSRVLVPAARDFAMAYPRLKLEIIGSEGNQSLSRREADIALRFDRVQGSATICRRMTDIAYYIGAAADIEAPESLPWVTYDDAHSHFPQSIWIAKQIAKGSGNTLASVTVNDAEGLLQAVRAGIGKSLLPDYIVRNREDITLLSEVPAVTRPLWLMIQPELRKTRRVRAVVDWLDGMFGTSIEETRRQA